MVFFKSLNSFKGQATVEYILLLVVVITIALGIGGPLGRHLRDFSGALLGPGGYYACLTEEGLLPGTSQCEPKNIPNLNITIAGGGGPGSGSDDSRDSDGSGSSDDSGDSDGSGSSDDSGGSDGFGSSDDSGGSDGSDSNASSSKGDSSGRNKSSRHKAGNGEGSSSGAGELSGQNSSEELSERQSRFLADSRDSRSKKKGRKKRGKRKKRIRAGEDDLMGNQFKKNKKGYKRTKSKMRINRTVGYLGEQMDFEEEESPPIFKVEGQVKTKGADKSEEKKGKLVKDQQTTSKTELKEDNRGINFSAFLKYIVIAIIIIAILIVIFSQIMEYQSRE